MESFMDEVAGQDDGVAVLLVRKLDRFSQVIGGNVSAAVEVGKLNDTKAGKGIGQPGDGNLMVVQFEPGRFDVVAVGQAGPAAPDPAGPSSPSPAQAGLRAQPSRYVTEHLLVARFPGVLRIPP